MGFNIRVFKGLGFREFFWYMSETPKLCLHGDERSIVPKTKSKDILSVQLLKLL